MRQPLALLLAIVFSSACFAAQSDSAEEKPGPKPLPGVDITWGLKIPLRDGVELNATLYRPHLQKEPLPAVFTLTPYISDSYHNRAWYFAQNGFVFLLVDVRGRGNSGGSFDPMRQEPPDGHDVVEWLARQPWCNGKVSMWGGSYAGFDQWMTLRERPPHLATIVPVASPYIMVDFPGVKGIFFPYDMQWLEFTSGHAGQSNLFAESAYWISKAQEYYRGHLAFRDYDRVVGDTSTVFATWVQHPNLDAYWQKLTMSPDDFRAVSVPVLTITGMYDGDQAGAMTYYRSHMRYGSDQAKANHFLIVGPWDHAGTRTPQKEVGGLTFGEASVIDLNQLHKDWYAWTMKASGKRPEFLKKRVAYYVTGSDEWKYADTLDGIPTELRTLYLNSAGINPGDVTRSGQLALQKPARGADAYVYDPLDTRFGEQYETEDIKNYITDQRSALNLFGNGLVYSTDPFPQETELSGFPKLVAWISMDVPDTDFEANLYEIKPDGTSIALSGDLLRARFRESHSRPTLVKPGEIVRYEFSGFTFFSRKVARGSRLRLVFSSPNSINFEKNYNSGGNIEAETARDARTAHVTLYHDAQHASYLELPVVK